MASDAIRRRPPSDPDPHRFYLPRSTARCIGCGRKHVRGDPVCPSDKPAVYRCEVWTTEASVVGPDGGWHEMYAGRKRGAETTAKMEAGHGWAAVRIVGPDGTDVVVDERG